MNFYSKKQRWKLFLIIIALAIGGSSLYFTNRLVKKLADEEEKKVKIWAQAINKKVTLVNYTREFFDKIAGEERKKVELYKLATERLLSDDVTSDLDFYLNIISGNDYIPIILTSSEDIVISSVNLEKEIPKNVKMNDSLLREFGKYEPLEVKYKGKLLQKIYYKDSRLFSQLQVVMNDLIESFISEVVINSASVPVIITDSTRTKIVNFGNISSSELNSEEKIKERLSHMESQNEPIQVVINEQVQHVYYEDSFLLTQLKYYPAILISIIAVFLFIAYLAFNSSRKAEQNQLWVGMAKETAHQLGTPTSSLLAWIELLKLKNVDQEIISEVEKDVSRLEVITERFSKIGAAPALDSINLNEILKTSAEYIRNRSSEKVKINIQSQLEQVFVPLNVPLFEWVIENLLKNAIDAMEGEGTIDIIVSDYTQVVYIDIKDTGKGIPKSKYKTVFQPGYTTKKRGWGLGLSLTRRIIEYYHKGKIFVKSSEINKGTTFRIALKKQQTGIKL
ncbi:MAG: hypothetical protein A2W91_16655 [Bacteroidetes bacterium GWF2_38_335]|nr:MAG: hypothetical protein A2W91_16655 [Bacteroidetes bacterium GWF2_38_335]OFY81318.1 MAG: hypothetical protein A2281_07630 [Bacteroidetes bacterium RIFOXYA12_FULL_38_20]HBS85439.1 ATP-binding protein [Bacteroidales bacterium]